MRDLIQGNPKLREMGFKEEASWTQCHCRWVQGQRQWTDFYPNGDYSEALLNTSFDWNGIREAYVVATENDAQRCSHALWSFADKPCTDIL